MNMIRPSLAVGLVALLAGCSSTSGGADSLGGGTAATATAGSQGSTTAGTSAATGAATGSGGTTTTGTTTAGKQDLGLVFDVGASVDGGGGGGGPVDESTCEKAAESLTSAGCRFAPVIMQPTSNLPWAVVAANTNVQDAQVTLWAADGAMIEQAMVPAGMLHTFVIPGSSALMNAHNLASQTMQAKRAMILESDIPIVAAQYSPYSSSQNATSDASMLFPEHAWGDDYLAVAYKNDDGAGAWITVVSLQDGNEVTVTASPTMGGSTQGGVIAALSAGQSDTVTLGAQEILRVYAPGGANPDLTGMRVTSTKPVSIFAGAPSMSIPGPGFVPYMDHLEEQMPPRTAWGKAYAAVHFRPRSTEPDLYRFIADKDGTVIDLSGDVQDMLMLDEGEFVDVKTPESFYASSDQPFAVFHFMYSQSLTPGPKNDAEYPGNFLSPNCAVPSQSTTELGDPAVSFFPAVEQYRFNYTFLTPATYAWDMVTVIGPTAGWDTILLDGAALPEPPTDLGVAGLGYARFLVPDGPHEIRSDTVKFGLEVYGYDCRVSYAYPGGLSLSVINPPQG